MADTTLGLVLSENDDEACSAEQARELAEAGAVNDPDGPTITLSCGATSTITQESFDALETAGIIDSNGNVLEDFGNTAVATATMLPQGIPVTVARGSGYNSSSELTVNGGTATTPAVITPTSFSTVAAQDETDYDGAGSNGTFTAGSGYGVSDTITLSDGTVITVDAVGSVTGGDVTEFTVTTPSTSGHANNATLSQSSTSGGGTSFDVTQGDDNQGIFAGAMKQIAEVPIGDYSELPSDPVSTTDSGSGSGATFNVDWGVLAVTVTEGGEGYTSAPAVSFTGGSGSTATSSLTDDAVTSVTVASPGSGYSAVAGVVIAAP
jgi:hypothetical protein